MKSAIIIALTTYIETTLAQSPIGGSQSWIKTHQQHGHLPGGKDNPGFIPGLFKTVKYVLKGNDPVTALALINEENNVKNGEKHTVPLAAIAKWRGTDGLAKPQDITQVQPPAQVPFVPLPPLGDHQHRNPEPIPSHGNGGAYGATPIKPVYHPGNENA